MAKNALLVVKPAWKDAIMINHVEVSNVARIIIYQMGLSCMGTAPGGLLANVKKQQNSPPIQLITYGHVKNSVS